MNVADRTHPSREELAAHLAGRLNAVESDTIEQHLNECQSCCQILNTLPNDDTIATTLRQQATDTSVANDSQPAIPETIVPDTGEETRPPQGEPTQFADSSAAQADLPLELRDHPRYRIVELLGHGGMGDVYRAEHKVMNRPVALKVIKPQLVQNDSAVRRFHREVQAAAQLHHPHIVTAHDAEQAGDLHYLVMEFVDGEDLDEVIRDRGPLPVDEACDYIRQAAEGLQYAHELGMVHRDIKPHNLMVESRGSRVEGEEAAGDPSGSGHSALDPRPSIKILDFGLANFANETAAEEVEEQHPDHHAPAAEVLHQLTQMGTMMGTPDYIAPEQAQDAHAADIRADIYSLGCTFYTLLTGKAPFSEGSVLDKVKAHTHEDAPPLADFRDDVPPEVEAVLQKMMAKDPAERYQTPAEVAEALSAVGRIGNPSMRADGRIANSSYRRRRPLILTAVATLFLALTAATIFYIQTDNGVVRVEVTDPSLKVTIAGQTITMDDGEKPLTIRAGEQKLIVRQKDSDFELVTDSFQLRRGDEIALKVDLLPGQVVVSKEDGTRLGAKSIDSPTTGPIAVSVADLGPPDSEDGHREAIVRLFNRSNKPVTSVRVRWLREGAPLSSDKPLYPDLVWTRQRGSLKPGERYATTLTISRPIPKLTASNARVTHVLFADGTEWTAGESWPKGDALAEEWNRLAGHWRTVSWESAHRPVEPDDVTNLEFLFDAEERTICFIEDGKPEFMQAELDPTGTLKRIDLKSNAGDKDARTYLGLYKLEGDELTICLAYHGSPRPDEFKFVSKPDNRRQLFVLRRVESNENNEIRLVFGAEERPESNPTVEIPGVLKTEKPQEALERIREMVAENAQLVVVVDVSNDLDPRNFDKLFNADSVRKMVAGTGAAVRFAPRLLAVLHPVDPLLQELRRNQLKQIGLGLLSFEEQRRFLPPGKVDFERDWFDENGRPHLSWRVHILPYIEQQELYDKFHLDEPWDSEHNKRLLAEMPPQFKTTGDTTRTSMQTVVGKGTAYEGKGGLPLTDFTDGTANTVLVVDAGRERAVPWTKPEDLPFDREDPIRAFGTSDFGDVFLALMADGSVQSIPYDTAPASLRALFTRAGGDRFDPTANRNTPLPEQASPEQFAANHLKAVGASATPFRAAFVPDAPSGKRVVVMTGRTLQMWDAEKDVLLWSQSFDPHTVERRFGRRLSVGHGGLFAVSKDYIALATTTVGTHCALLMFHTDSGEMWSIREHPRITEFHLFDDGKKLGVVYEGDKAKYMELTIDLSVKTGFDTEWPTTSRDEWIKAVAPEKLTAVRHLDDRTIALGTDAGRIVLYDKADNRVQGSMTGHTGAVVHLSPAGKGRLVSASRDKTIRLWDIATGRELTRLHIADGESQWMDVSADGTRLLTPAASLKADQAAVTEGKHQAHIWQLPQIAPPERPKDELKHLGQLEGHGTTVIDLAWHPDGKRAVSIGSRDSEVRMWDVAERKTVWTWKPTKQVENQRDHYTIAVAISADGKRVAAGDADGTIYLLDAENGKELKSWPAYEDGKFTHAGIAALDFSPDGELLASVGRDQGTGKVWQLQTGKQVINHTNGPDALDIAFSQDGEAMISAGHSATYREVDEDKDGLKIISGGGGTGHDLKPQSVAVSPRGDLYAFGYPRGEIHLYQRRERNVWAATKLSPGMRFDHAGTFVELAFTPDGRHLISGSPSLIIWSYTVEDGKFTLRPILEKKSDSDGFFNFALSPDGKTLLTIGDEDGTDGPIHIWRLPQSVWPKE